MAAVPDILAEHDEIEQLHQNFEDYLQYIAHSKSPVRHYVFNKAMAITQHRQKRSGCVNSKGDDRQRPGPQQPLHQDHRAPWLLSPSLTSGSSASEQHAPSPYFFGVRSVSISSQNGQVELRSQALTSNWIKETTNMPLLSVISYDTTRNNDVRHPYILVTHLPGKRVCKVWNESGKGLESHRSKILTAIAKTVSKLQSISFPSSGMLYFEADGTEPYIGKTYEVLEDGIGHDGQVLHRTQISATFSSSNDHSRADNGEASASLAMGQYEVLRLVVDCLPFPVGEKETFTITPPDFDWQNILVDDDGNVTGSIEWDTTCASSPARFPNYRIAYAEAISAAMDGQGDCMLTYRLVLRALADALKYTESTLSIIERILHLVLPTLTVVQYLKLIGVRVPWGEWSLHPWEGQNEFKTKRRLRKAQNGSDPAIAVEPCHWIPGK
ncbi:hypothetical protein IWZ01DRAFT_483851 [Phyllosticta capitalensis]